MRMSRWRPRSLGKIRDRRAVDALIACLTANDQSWLDYAAAEALGEIGDERALGPLLAALGRSSLREPVLEALARSATCRRFRPYQRTYRPASHCARSIRCRPCRRLPEEPVCRTPEDQRCGPFRDRGPGVPLLEELIDTSGGELQKAAVAVLGWTGRPSAAPKLLSLLRDEEMEDIVVQALRHWERTVCRCSSADSDDNVLVRRVVAMVWDEIGRREAEDALLPCSMMRTDTSAAQQQSLSAGSGARKRAASPAASGR